MNAKARVAALGLTAALALASTYEGRRLATYSDPVGIPTICDGHTGPDVYVGRKATNEECDEYTAADLLKANAVVDRCITVPLSANQRNALVDFAYNIGPGKAGVKDGLCVLKNGRIPTIRRRFNAGDYVGGCRAFNEGGAWTNAGGKQLRGLVLRRAAERELCERP